MHNPEVSTLTMTLSKLYNTQNIRGNSLQRKLSETERENSKRKYRSFSSCSKDEQKQIVEGAKTARAPFWRENHYRTNTFFEVPPKNQLDRFPHNTQKYNIQFLDRSLHGRNLRFPSKGQGLFSKPQQKLYSKHYIPIVRSKEAYNQDYQLRTSMFGQTWVDQKRSHIMNQYKMQANPFRTPVSNQLIRTMRPERRHRHKV